MRYASALLLFFTIVPTATAQWLELKQNPELWNNVSFMRENVAGIVATYQSHVGDSSYQSERFDIERAARQVTSAEVAKLFYDFARADGPNEPRRLANDLYTIIGENIPEVQQEILSSAARAKTSDALLGRVRSLVTRWSSTPPELFELVLRVTSNSNVPEVDRTKLLEQVARRAINIETTAIDAYMREGFLQLATQVKEPALLAEVASGIARSARAGPQAYLELARLINAGEVLPAETLVIMRTVSHEINGIINTTLKDLTVEARESLFELVRQCSRHQSPVVRAAAMSVVIWQEAGKFLPQDLRNWFNKEVPADAEMLKEYRAVHQSLRPGQRQYFEKRHRKLRASLGSPLGCSILGRLFSWWR